MKHTKIFYSLIFLLLSSLSVYAQQEQIQLVGAGSLQGGVKNGVRFNRLIQNVHLKQKETDLYCDSAHLYRETNTVEVFSNVRVTQGTLVITSNTAVYDGNKRNATFKGNVNLRDDKMTLTTPSLFYDMVAKTSRYTEGGTILEESNTLTSQLGYYNTITKLLAFKGNVHLISPDADITSDTLQYNTQSKLVFFVAPTQIKNEDGLLTAKGGTYNTVTKESVFRGSRVETPDYLVDADYSVYDRAAQYLYASGKVKLTSKDPDNKTIITGQVLQSWKTIGKTKVYGSPVMRSLVSEDTLYVSSDTLIAINHDKVAKQKDPKLKDFIYAFYDVRIYKSDLQGKCDSLTYSVNDSIMYLDRNPIVWSEKSQLVADSMEMFIRNKALDHMYLYNNSFIISEDTLQNFNQVKGRNMEAFFKEGQLAKVNVNGNGESIYFALEGDTAVTGMNRSISSDLILRFREGKVNTVSLLTNPEASFIPPHELKEPDKRLKGFSWRIEEQPTKEIVLTKRTPKQATPKPEKASVQKTEPTRKKSLFKKNKKPNVQ
ncbi:OstA-like protein [Adhaeribacter radiodurans]|uniref:LPS export ABC transporter periplasmic protein LptC n=1 Tax=Adhaeribacter radiodurans TaxID=2745197 RepID=A0A7L7L4U0_9BACT|nr:OstA-like protein [Adhaeribacter radiodurans]QMU27399.1 LPS export ABC transporter periplasmic protein LptC [Adhaeribacter radiodurans]